MIEIYRKEPTKETLKEIYDVCNKIFKNEKYFYSTNETKILKKDANNNFIK